MEIISCLDLNTLNKPSQPVIWKAVPQKRTPAARTAAYKPAYKPVSVVRMPVVRVAAKPAKKQSVAENLDKACAVAGKSLQKFSKTLGISLLHSWKTLASVALLALLACSLAVGGFAGYDYIIDMPQAASLSINLENESAIISEAMNSFVQPQTDDFTEDGTVSLSDEGFSLIPEPVTFSEYKVMSGDTISSISLKFGLRNISTLIAVNNISNVRKLQAGQKLKVPSMDGILYTVQQGDSLDGIAAKYKVPLEDLLDVNDLESSVLAKGTSLFIPGAALDNSTLKQALGELFKLPLASGYRITSEFGSRADPFTGVASNHTGIDLAIAQGTPIKAAMSGKVATVGWTNVYGNYVIVTHSNGYQTLYAHMQKYTVKSGQYVDQGTQIGLVGSTGYSTGPHLHFSVYKNGSLVNPRTILSF